MNVEKIKALHEPFYIGMKHCQEETQPIVCGISNILLDHMRDFTCPYRAFCSLQPQSLEIYHSLIKQNQDFGSLMKQVYTTSPECRLGLPSLLLKPVQRITRYPLLIKVSRCQFLCITSLVPSAYLNVGIGYPKVSARTIP